LIYFESTGLASEELFSVNLSTGDRVLVNDSTNANAIKSYRALVMKPRITSIVRSGTNVVIEWVNGSPPFQVQTTPDLLNPAWGDVGSPTTNRTATVPVQPGAAFIRVFGQ
jgi:hypothetical protein